MRGYFSKPLIRVGNGHFIFVKSHEHPPGEVTGRKAWLSCFEGLAYGKDASPAASKTLKKFSQIGLNADKDICLLGSTKNEWNNI